MPKRHLLLFFAAAILLTMAGCSKNIIVNIDGMPISNHEYNLTNDETGIRAVFILARYYREYEGDKEYIVKPEYLDALAEERIDPSDTENLLLHLKIVNLKKVQYTVQWQAKGPGSWQMSGLIYNGKLSRRDFYVKLPTEKPGLYEYSVRVLDANGDDLYDLPQMRYKVKGGVKISPS